MKAWEIAYNIFSNAQPRILDEEDQTWKAIKKVSKFYDDNISLDWGSNVPGSGAPEKIMVASIQALENRGYDLTNSYELLDEGLKAHQANDFIKLHKISAEMRNNFLNAKRDENSDYWEYKIYDDFEQYKKSVSFSKAVNVDTTTETFRDKTKAAWLSQIIGAAMGTMVEGYTSKNLYAAFGEVKEYLREPNTFNDDITFELAFLDAFKEKGYNITSKDIALAWVGLIPSGWSAEEVAIRNIRAGIMPPQSGTHNNPFNEWIGAQMRGAICGMVAPGNPELAAELAWKDGRVSHANNGILGEVFNAIMVSLAYVCDDVKEILKTTIGLIPVDSEYFSVVDFAYKQCLKFDDWHDALSVCEEKYKKYNWIHSYPNICCEIIALMYGDNDYEKTLQIVTMCGIDVDCNAGMIMPIIGIQKGMCIIPKKLIHEAFYTLETYMRGYERITLDELVDDTLYTINNSKTFN
ncbi:ADP-ribosylglycohydrolase family protein [Sedimentibacter sp. zth1]|uniref:ADP-ribosylglycohydrolase family protein n=1 Tax=Sedimentibacter sp. zth1 TaxID=2816908 RepID=UPI001A932EB7|nr:ADP-ribosylglycohydrolase family protein [Sedimentibacter sp. zth1]QSX04948.1 ADP-ribosylglycohydrolase family protein [Sedimentibacter sp. zth1]